MNFMEFAFADDISDYKLEDTANIQIDLRRAVTQWLYILSGRKMMVGKIDKQFRDHVKSWGYWKELEGQPLDTIAITLRDLINSYLAAHPVIGTAEVVNTTTTILGMQMKPSDNVAKTWKSMLMLAGSCRQYKLCVQCNKPFAFQSHRATYCSDACRTRASRERNAPS
jgi:hypothetical protein